MKRNTTMVILVLVIFFVISFLTNVLGPLIPDIIENFKLSLGLAGFLPFSFFVAYGVMSIPAGLLIEKYSEKAVLIGAFSIAFLGALSVSAIQRGPDILIPHWYWDGHVAGSDQPASQGFRR
jgi:fucose permease